MLILSVSMILAWFYPRWLVLVFSIAATLVFMALTGSTASLRSIDFVAAAGQVLLTTLMVLCAFYARRELERAWRLARVDSLTGLPNRQVILETIEAELGRVRRFGRSLSLIMFDCDGFKAINDRLGHLAGDRALQQLAGVLRQQTRAYDCVGRLAGDEFVLILPETNADEVATIAERLRGALAVEMTQEFPSLTVCMGVTTMLPPDNPAIPTPDCLECLRRADDALYAAKRLGPDHVCFSDECSSKL